MFSLNFFVANAQEPQDVVPVPVLFEETSMDTSNQTSDVTVFEEIEITDPEILRLEAIEGLEAYLDARQDVLDLISLCNGSIENCTQDQTVILESLKNLLSQRLSTFDFYFRTMLGRLSETENLTETEKQVLTALIQSYENKIDEYRISIESSQDVEELRSISSSMRSDLGTALKLMKVALGKIHVSRAEILLEELSKDLEIAQTHILAAESVENEVSSLNTLYNEVSDNIAVLEQNYAEVFESFDTAGESADPITAAEEAQALLLESNALLREGYDSLQTLTDELTVLYSINPWSLE